MEQPRVSMKRKRDHADDVRPRQRHPSERDSRDTPTSNSRQAGKTWHKDQMRLNQLQEEERMREWVAQEDDFVLRQAKKKAEIRVREGRANAIDWLAVTLRPIDATRNLLDDEVDDAELDFTHPEAVFEPLSERQLGDLRKDIDTYLHLETNRTNREYWKTMQIVCKDQQRKLHDAGSDGRAVGTVSSDIDRLLGPKSLPELETLEKQIRNKLDSDEPIDTDYWQHLLDSLLVWKAKAKMKEIYSAAVGSRLQTLRSESEKQAQQAQESYSNGSIGSSAVAPEYSRSRDPDPLLHVPAKDTPQGVMDEKTWLRSVATDRRRIAKMGFVPLSKSQRPQKSDRCMPMETARRQTADEPADSRSLYDKDVARGVDEDEEVFTGEEQVETKDKDMWKGDYKPRKPKYFNRVQMGYEWNKYNQTHYDADNPPPKVVQGYKFHIFYPDLIDNCKAPTFKIFREGGRKKGQSIALAGEEDTCIIRFMAGPPYEDIAFRIVDRDWDYSAKYDRGFKSTFDRGILTLHFSFKKIFYRK